MPQFGTAADGARRDAASPLRLVLIALIVVAIGAVAGLVVASLVVHRRPRQYQNDDYKVPAARHEPAARSRSRRPTTQAEELVTNNAFYTPVRAAARCGATPSRSTSRTATTTS